MKKKLYFFILLIIMVIVLIVCVFSNIDSKRKLLKYANKNYGKAECIEYIKNGNQETATFKDKEYGFIYTVTIDLKDFILDGSNFFKFKDIISDFTIKYINYIEKQIMKDKNLLENKYDCKIEWNYYYSEVSYGDVLLNVNTKNNNTNYQTVLEELGRIIQNADNRKFFKRGTIYILYNDNFAGKYSFEKQKFVNISDSEIDRFREALYIRMSNYLDIEIKEESELIYIKNTKMDIKDIPGLDINEIAYRTTDTTETLKNTEVYYFEHKGNTWIIADCITRPYGNLYIYKLK